MTDEPTQLQESAFSTRLEPLGRILEDRYHYIWGCSPIYGPDGTVHVFYSRWRRKHGMIGWLIDCEIVHAVADHPAGPYQLVDDPVVLAGAGGDNWDGVTVHNPEVHEVDGGYVMLYVGNSLAYSQNLVERTKIGMAFADSLDGPWTRHPDNPIIDRGERGEWDSVSVDTPSLLAHPDGRYFIYYRSWTGRDSDVRNDTIGVAIAEDLLGPYEKHPENPIIDPRTLTDQRPVGVEDPCAFVEDGTIHLLTRDFGVQSGRSGFSPCSGLLFSSEDGIDFAMPPEIGYHEAERYYGEAENDHDLIRYGRFERPKVLMEDGHPRYLFNAMRGGPFGTATGHVFEVDSP
ncbi:glycoside hydrolase family protein [Haloarchaeobius sp. HME9146]|uniref:glycoside hydrolase family protein n=1 Tax=Haloarchaeobius sp. HME9146 TaxID=2978732 RepID=UPI0021BFFFC4|nr:glycoside hydrolase family protein [Haloarchaeobius sp. HME9146]MCT9098047.1 glycoside hydrolase family protein [Haloarchaeobius sp. HME9146]